MALSLIPAPEASGRVVPTLESSGELQSWTETQRSRFQEEPIQRWPRMLGNALDCVSDKVFTCNVEAGQLLAGRMNVKLQ